MPPAASASAPTAAPAWPFVPGEAAARIGALDAARCPLGDPSVWPAALRRTLELILPARAEIVLFWGPQCIAFYNDAYAPTIGLKHPAALGRPAAEFWGELWDDLHPLLRRVLELGETVSARDRPFHINRQGALEDVFFDISYSPIREAGGRVGGVLCVVCETTARVRATRALATSESHLRELNAQWQMAQEAGGVGVFTLDLLRSRVLASPGFCRIFGLPQQAEVAAEDIEALCEKQADDAEPWIWTHQGGADWVLPPVVEFPIRRASDGALRWVSRRAQAEHDASGRAVLMRGVVQDVTDRHEAQAALQALNATLEQRIAQRTRERDRLWRLSTDIMVVCTLEGAIVAVNPAWQATLGWAEHELLGHQVLDIVDPDDLAMSTVQHQRVAAGHIATRFENHCRHKDGSLRTISWSAVPHEGFIHAVGRDMTSLRESEQRLRHSQKMEAIGQLSGGIAHDFNNMLQGITGALEVMRRRLAKGQTGDLDRFMDSATQSALRAASLVQRLLAFSRRQSLDLRALDVNALIASMQELMARTLGEQIRLHVDLAADAAAAFGDESQLESAILNLAINARDAMPEGGELHIATRNAELGHAEVQDIDGLQPGHYLALTVRDTGTGMTPEVLARAFDPFFTTKPVGQGTGLGLSMIYGFAQQSGGHVRIASTPGAGTTVTLLLPQARELPAKAAPAVDNPLPQGRGETVLVVEDDPGVRLLVLEVLAELGYHAQQATEAQAALQIVRAGGRIDLMVSDIGLPGLNGRQLAEMVRALRPELPVLLMTGYAEYATHRARFLGPGMALIAKPFRVEDLAHRIDAMVRMVRQD